MKLTDLTFREFLNYWPAHHGGSWFTGSEIVWVDEAWTIQPCDYECLSIAGNPILIHQSDPFPMFAALQAITDEMDDDQVTEIVRSVPSVNAQTYAVTAPRSSNYWSDFDGEYYSDGLDDSEYVWHRNNGVLTLRSELDDWAEDLAHA